jgi:hypothetical protein
MLCRCVRESTRWTLVDLFSIAHAGLPPVTADWFEARKAQLAALTPQRSGPEVFVCPLTKKRFQSEATYNAHTQSRKFKAAMKAAGMQEVPEPRVLQPSAPDAADKPHILQRPDDNLVAQLRGIALRGQQPRSGAHSAGAAAAELEAGIGGNEHDDEAEEEEGSSGWETDDTYGGPLSDLVRTCAGRCV